ncbi:MAG: class I SAM-dependent methyltransferase [Candidatus Altiarchaeota archaeon]
MDEEGLRGRIIELYGRCDELGDTVYSIHSGIGEVDLEGDLELNRGHVEKFSSVSGIKVGGRRVLDVGCSAGDFAFALSERAAEVVGIEPSPELVEIASRKKEYFGKDNLSFVRCVGEKLPFPEGSFDVVACKTVLEHVSDVGDCVKEMSRVLAGDGVLYVEAPNYLWIYEGHYRVFMVPFTPKWLFRLYARLLGKDPDYISHIKYITVHGVRRIMEDAGLRVENYSADRFRRILVEADESQVPGRLGFMLPLLGVLRATGLSGILYRLIAASGFHPTIILAGAKKSRAGE